MEISVVGTSFRVSPVHVREQLVLTEDLARRLMRTCRAEGIFQEGLVLSTCNRTELYFVTGDGRFSVGHLLDHIAGLKGCPAFVDASFMYRHDGLPAVEHLLRVAASLDSQVVGEHEILGQVKEAFRWARSAGTARFLLNKLMHRALRCGKRVRAETDLGAGATSVSGAAVELAIKVFSGLEGRTALVIGAGRNAELAAGALMRAGVAGLIIANRTPARARELAARLSHAYREAELVPEDTCPALHRRLRECSLRPSAQERKGQFRADAIALSEIPAVIGAVDLVISSTAAPGYVLTWDALRESLESVTHPLLMMDIAVPRDIDPRLSELTEVSLHNIDDLERTVEENLLRRQKEIPRAEAIVRHEVEQFGKWLERLQVVPTIKLLGRRFEQLRLAQIQKSQGRLAASEREELDRFSLGLCKKILHGPIAYLRKVSADGAAGEPEVLELIRQMFNLDALEGEE